MINLALFRRMLCAVPVAACLYSPPRTLFAQNATALRDGSFEIGILAGDTLGGLVPADTGLANFGGFRIKSPGSGAVGVSVAIAANPKLLFYGQVSAWKGEHRDRPLTAGYSAATNLFNLVYEGGFERVFPLSSRTGTAQSVSGRAHRPGPFALYVLGAGSTIQKRVDVVVNYTDPNPNPSPSDVLGAATRVRLKKAVFAPVVGVGARYYFAHRFGIRIESKAYFPTGDVPRPTGVASGGIFVDLP